MIIKTNNQILYTTNYKPAFDEGSYDAVIVEVKFLENCKTDWGFRDFLEIIYDVSVGITTQAKKEKLMISEAEGSKCYKFLTECYKGNIPQEISLNDLVGRECMLTLKHNTDSKGRTFVNITERVFK